MRSRIFAITLLLCASALAEPSSTPASTERSLVVKAGQLLDVRSGRYLRSAAVYVEGERISAVGPANEIMRRAPAGVRVVDLGEATMLPGLIDCHTHLMARIPEGSNGYAVNLATKSQAYRALEGAADARTTLQAGFTTVRDVESEGSGYADVALRDAIQDGLVEGPRMLVATRGIAAVGQYQPFGTSPDLTEFPTGAQMISGQEEAHKAKRKLAAHATTPEGIHNAIVAGVDSIEHGHLADRADLELMKSKGVYLVPTLSVIDALVASAPDNWSSPAAKARLEAMDQMMVLAKQLGVKIADGSDPASATRHGRNAEELAAMVHRGLTPLEAIRAATVSAADLIGWPDVGAIESGKFADLIAVQGDPLEDIRVLQKVAFVMKGGEIVKD